MDFPQELLDELIAEAKADEVGLWLIVSTLSRQFGITDSKAIKVVTLQCIDQLLRTGHVIAGYYSRSGPKITAWQLDVDDTLTRIAREWDELGREPTIGDIVVFVGTENQLAGSE